MVVIVAIFSAFVSREALEDSSPGMILSETVFPASLIRLTMSECDLLVMEQPLTASIRSPTFSFPQRSAGLPSMMRPILWGMATQAFPAFVLIYVFVLCVHFACRDDLFDCVDWLYRYIVWKKRREKENREKEKLIMQIIASQLTHRKTIRLRTC